MKATHLIMALALLAMTRFIPAAVAGDQPPAPPAVSRDSGRAAEYVEAIRHAPDPSTAVSAYANAVAADRDSLAPAEAYVHRMIELGTPGMAYAQALDLSQREPGNGLAWGILADVDARRGQFVAALADIATAARLAPNDPFVQQTAAQLLAWYDTTADQTEVPADLKHSLNLMRQELQKAKGFAEIYSRAKDYYKQMAEEEQQAGAAGRSSGTDAAAQPPDVSAGDTGDSAPPVIVGPPDTTYIYAPYPYYESSIDYYPPSVGYPFYPGYPCYAGSYWWGAGPYFIGAPGPFYHHRGFGFNDFGFRRHGYGYRGFDHGRGFGHDGFRGAPAVVDHRMNAGRYGGFNHGGFGTGPMATGRFTNSPSSVSPNFSGAHTFGHSIGSPGGRSFIAPRATTFGGTHSFGHSFNTSSGTSFGGSRSFDGGGHSSGGGTAFGGSHSFGSGGGGSHSFGGGGMGGGHGGRGGGHGR